MKLAVPVCIKASAARVCILVCSMDPATAVFDPRAPGLVYTRDLVNFETEFNAYSALRPGSVFEANYVWHDDGFQQWVQIMRIRLEYPSETPRSLERAHVYVYQPDMDEWIQRRIGPVPSQLRVMIFVPNMTDRRTGTFPDVAQAVRAAYATAVRMQGWLAAREAGDAGPLPEVAPAPAE